MEMRFPDKKRLVRNYSNDAAPRQHGGEARIAGLTALYLVEVDDQRVYLAIDPAHGKEESTVLVSSILFLKKIVIPVFRGEEETGIEGCGQAAKRPESIF